MRRDIALGSGSQNVTAEWGVIITADCDIAQEKMGEFFTYLVLRSAREYVRHVWATEEISKLVGRHGKLAVEQILRSDQTRDPNATPMTVAQLSEWVLADGVEAILDAVKSATGNGTVTRTILRPVLIQRRCPRSNGPLIEIDRFGERLVGCIECNRWTWPDSETISMALREGARRNVETRYRRQLGSSSRFSSRWRFFLLMCARTVSRRSTGSGSPSPRSRTYCTRPSAVAISTVLSLFGLDIADGSI